MAIKRIKREFLDLRENPSADCNAWVTDESDFFSITASITGPEGTPYQDGLFFLELCMPSDYPFKPPKLRFITKIYHPCIGDPYGLSCSSLDSWLFPSPHFTLRIYLEGIRSMLKNFTPLCKHNPYAVMSYEDDWPMFEATARDWTRRFAM